MPTVVLIGLPTRRVPGMRAGADVSMMDAFMKNILPVTIGNIIAGAVIFAGSYSFLYGKLGGHSKDDESGH